MIEKAGLVLAETVDCFVLSQVEICVGAEAFFAIGYGGSQFPWSRSTIILNLFVTMTVFS